MLIRKQVATITTPTKTDISDKISSVLWGVEPHEVKQKQEAKQLTPIETVHETIELSSEQYLTDIIERIPRTPGFHHINAKTGVGKTVLMMIMSMLYGYTIFFPVKAIKQQQEHDKVAIRQALQEAQSRLSDIDREAAGAFIEKLEAMWKKVGTDITLQDADIVQIECLDIHRQHKGIFADESHILYEGGFRKAVEDFLAMLEKESKRVPVYLCSATQDNSLLPDTIKLSSVIVADKPMKRKLNVIQIDALNKADVNQSTTWILAAIDHIMKVEKKNTLIFTGNMQDDGERVLQGLNDNGFKTVGISSGRLAKDADGNSDYPEAVKAFNDIVATRSISATGYQCVYATKCLAEGINIDEDIVIIALQAHPSLLFQEFGRARDKGSFWLITGTGMDKVSIVDGKPIKRVSQIANPDASYDERKWEYFDVEVEAPTSKMNDICKWKDPVRRKAAMNWMVVAKEYRKGSFAAETIKQLGEWGYELDEVLHTGIETEALKQLRSRVEFKTIKKSVMLDAVEKHGCPRYFDSKHPLLVELMESHQLSQLNKVRDAVEWHSYWDDVAKCGTKLGCWDIYRRINKLGRSFFVYAFSTPSEGEYADARFNFIMGTVAEFRDGLSSMISQYKSELGTGYLISDEVNTVSEAFWDSVLDKEAEKVWFSDDNSRTRRNVFCMLVGMTQNEVNNNWYMPTDKPWWYVDVDRNTRDKLKRKADKLAEQDITIESFCESTQLNRAEVAGLKSKAFKLAISELVSIN